MPRSAHTCLAIAKRPYFARSRAISAAPKAPSVSGRGGTFTGTPGKSARARITPLLWATPPLMATTVAAGSAQTCLTIYTVREAMERFRPRTISFSGVPWAMLRSRSMPARRNTSFVARAMASWLRAPVSTTAQARPPDQEYAAQWAILNDLEPILPRGLDESFLNKHMPHHSI
jgi:hypothetical protein